MKLKRELPNIIDVFHCETKDTVCPIGYTTRNCFMITWCIAHVRILLSVTVCMTLACALLLRVWFWFISQQHLAKKVIWSRLTLMFSATSTVSHRNYHMMDWCQTQQYPACCLSIYQSLDAWHYYKVHVVCKGTLMARMTYIDNFYKLTISYISTFSAIRTPTILFSSNIYNIDHKNVAWVSENRQYNDKHANVQMSA